MMFSANRQQGAQYDGLGEKGKQVGLTFLQAFVLQVNTRLLLGRKTLKGTQKLCEMRKKKSDKGQVKRLYGLEFHRELSYAKKVD